MFLRRGAAAAAVAPLIASPAMQEQIEHAHLSVTDGLIRHSHRAPDEDESPIAKLARKTWGPVLRKADKHYEQRIAQRVGNLDPDIACLHSVSPQHKATMQRRRDDRALTYLDSLRAKMGWGEYYD